MMISLEKFYHTHTHTHTRILRSLRYYQPLTPSDNLLLKRVICIIIIIIICSILLWRRRGRRRRRRLCRITLPPIFNCIRRRFVSIVRRYEFIVLHFFKGWVTFARKNIIPHIIFHECRWIVTLTFWSGNREWISIIVIMAIIPA